MCDRDNDILAHGIIADEVDKQNLEIALCVFSEDVEDNICKCGDSHKADFVCLIQKWSLASDERGIHLKDRLESWANIHDYMNQFYDPSEYPPPSTHIYNLAIQSLKCSYNQ